jgi:hypothetical protein
MTMMKMRNLITFPLQQSREGRLSGKPTMKKREMQRKQRLSFQTGVKFGPMKEKNEVE